MIIVGLLILVVGLIWLATGVYTVGPGEQGVVRRFGKEVARVGSGLRYHWPRPTERVDVVNVEAVRRVEVGFRSTPRYQLVPQESLMLTGDENIVDAQAIVQYRVKDAGDYLETLQRVLPKAQKIVISPQLEGHLLPFLPLREQGPLGRPAAASDGQRGQTEVVTMPQPSPQPARSVR
jgi:regulator of protease activity HflC (stomatin/prohibitin superfamily)